MKRLSFGIILVSFVFLNISSILLDEDLLGDLFFINNDDTELIDEIFINEVFSNSFFFISKRKPNHIGNDELYLIKNQSSSELIYFKVNTVKKKDSLFFFQNIKWVTFKYRKLETGNYSLYKVDK